MGVGLVGVGGRLVRRAAVMGVAMAAMRRRTIDREVGMRR